MRPELTELSVAAVVLLDQHSCPSTLLELFLLMVTPKFALDKDGSLRHLLIKCILPQSRRIMQSEHVLIEYLHRKWVLVSSVLLNRGFTFNAIHVSLEKNRKLACD